MNSLSKTRRLKGVTIAVALPLALPLFFILGAATPWRAQAQAVPAVALGAATAAAPPAVVIEAALPPRRTVALVTPKVELWPEQLEAHGNVMPWQETRIGTEIGGLRLLSLLANVGDVVKKGQVLARLNPAPVEAEFEAASAQLMEAQATLAQAAATLDRGRRLAPSGGVSQQELTLYETQKQTAAARVDAARAQVKTQQLRLDSATLVAPDDGVISSRSVTEGAIVQAGSELFRLIRQGRLEWRAEVKGETLLKVAVGQAVTVTSPLGPEVKGRVRQVSPTIDLATRNGLVYVDLPSDTNLKAGLHVSGMLALSKRKALVLPSSAVIHENGASRVLTVNADSRLEAVDVHVGRVQNEHEEITSGIDAHSRVVAVDVGLLRAGEQVDVAKPEGEPKALPASAEPKKADD